ncbi:transcription elongation factor GreAB [Pseudomonas sp. HR96]|uniref:GreA/GreB family elongation factor n=1 Tax=Pseudomonas sp. HR96 TaxID=1027966 RepID=UPI002A7569AA|nr:transcription elongation factor GreAB [Pseudomonas sp. HR96]WPP02289.1 transcription elongation factor GreAB [Pseudomonas sp. HR96]
MDKQRLRQLIVERLSADLEVARRAAQTAYETATHEENVAENKYDTLGLEASYLATGQARRMEEIRQALQLYEKSPLTPYAPALGIATGSLVLLEDENGQLQHLLLGPGAAGLKIEIQGQMVTLITARSPLGQGLLGKFPGDEVQIRVAASHQRYLVVQVDGVGD